MVYNTRNHWVCGLGLGLVDWSKKKNVSNIIDKLMIAVAMGSRTQHCLVTSD
jgi:hypothetical protein